MTRSVQDCRWDQCSSQNIAKSSKIVKVKVGRERGNCCREWQGEQAQLNICLRFFIWRLHNQVYYVKYTTKLTCKACEMRKSRIIIDTPWQCPKVLIGTLIWKCGWLTDQSGTKVGPNTVFQCNSVAPEVRRQTTKLLSIRQTLCFAMQICTCMYSNQKFTLLLLLRQKLFINVQWTCFSNFHSAQCHNVTAVGLNRYDIINASKFNNNYHMMERPHVPRPLSIRASPGKQGGC